MKVLIAENDGFFRKMLQQLLTPDYEVTAVEDGTRAWDALQENNGPRLAILDYALPGLTGPQVCRNARSSPRTANTYLIILAAKNSIPEIVAGLRSGADDYLTKPFHPEEVRAHLRVARRFLELQSTLENRIRALNDALKRETFLQELLPICPACKARRSDSRYWQEVEAYIRSSKLSAGTCPQCLGKQAVGSRSAEAAGARR